MKEINEIAQTQKRFKVYLQQKNLSRNKKKIFKEFFDKYIQPFTPTDCDSYTYMEDFGECYFEKNNVFDRFICFPIKYNYIYTGEYRTIIKHQNEIIKIPISIIDEENLKMLRYILNNNEIY